MGGHRFKPEKAAKLLDPKRQDLIPVERVLSLLSLSGDEEIADLGCGNGYLTLPLLEKTKHVFAVDIEPKMLELLQERVEGAGYENISYIESNLEEIHLDDNRVSRAVAAFVAHEIPDLDQAIEEFLRILKPGGIILILDWEAIEMEMGPPLHERIPSETLATRFERHFHVETGHLNPGVYFLLAKKVKS